MQPLERRGVDGGGVAVLPRDEPAGGQLPVGGGDVQVDAGAVVHRLVQGGVPGEQGGVVGGQAGQGGPQTTLSARETKVWRFHVP